MTIIICRLCLNNKRIDRVIIIIDHYHPICSFYNEYFIRFLIFGIIDITKHHNSKYLDLFWYHLRDRVSLVIKFSIFFFFVVWKKEIKIYRFENSKFLNLKFSCKVILLCQKRNLINIYVSTMFHGDILVREFSGNTVSVRM